MRYALFMFICLIAIATMAKAADQPQSIVVTPAAPALVVTAAPWATSGTREFGPNYRSYVPVEIKSDTPEIVRTWDVTAHPGNSSHLTPEGMACASDADCQGILGCFNRADSGAVPQRLCALPPGR